MDSVLKDVKRCFSDLTPEDVVAAYLFGSHARGRGHRESDVDIAVIFDTALLPDRTSRSRRSVALSSTLIAALHLNDVQVVALNDATPELAATAVSEGLRVYCRDEEADRIFVRDVLLRHADLRPYLDRMRRIWITIASSRRSRI